MVRSVVGAWRAGGSGEREGHSDDFVHGWCPPRDGSLTTGLFLGVTRDSPLSSHRHHGRTMRTGESARLVMFSIHGHEPHRSRDRVPSQGALMSIRKVKRTLVASAAAAAAACGFSLLAFAGSAGATQTGTITPVGPYTAGTPFSSGQIVEVKVPSGLNSGQTVAIEECADPGGSAA